MSDKEVFCHEVNGEDQMCLTLKESNKRLEAYKAELKEKIRGLKDKPCKIEEDLGYHSKDCCRLYWNDALDQAINLLGDK